MDLVLMERPNGGFCTVRAEHVAEYKSRGFVVTGQVETPAPSEPAPAQAVDVEAFVAPDLQTKATKRKR